MNIRKFFILLIVINFKSVFYEKLFIEDIYDNDSNVFLNKYGYIVNDNQEILPVFLLLNFKTKNSKGLLENKIELNNNLSNWLEQGFRYTNKVIGDFDIGNEKFGILVLYPDRNSYNYLYKFYNTLMTQKEYPKRKFIRIPLINGFYKDIPFEKMYGLGIQKRSIGVYKKLIKKYENFGKNSLSFSKNLYQLKEKLLIIEKEKFWHLKGMVFYKFIFMKNYINKLINICDKKIKLINEKIYFLNEKIKDIKNLDLQD